MDTTQQVQFQLERFEFEALFVDVLGWEALTDRAHLVLPSLSSNSELASAQVRVLAAAAACSVVEVQLTSPWSLTSMLRERLYWDIAEQCVNPIVVFIYQNRSLWTWATAVEQDKSLHYHVYVNGQLDNWPLHLAGLHRHFLNLGKGGHPFSILSGQPPDLPQAQAKLLASLQALKQGISGIGRAADRQHYALVTLIRLIATITLQRGGWLDRGDEWYLHNKFGQSQQQSPNHFFQKWLSPLWFRVFILPLQERPLAVQQQFGDIPFVPTGPFQGHSLEQHYNTIGITDAAFEPALEWLGDLAETVPPHQLPNFFSPLFEQFVNAQEDLIATPGPIVEALCDRTLHAHLLHYSQTHLKHPAATWEDLLMTIPADVAGHLLEQAIDLALLDPACGSGRYLVSALEALGQACSSLTAIVQAANPAKLPAWLKREEVSARPLAIQRQILNGNFLGVDQSAQAIELARLQLFLSLISQTRQGQDLQSLPDVTLNVLQGNALIGLITVDSERFDQVQSRHISQAQPSSQQDVALQGDLLQPLVAENYRSILAERQIRLEHYRDRTYLLSEANGIPDYAQAEFLRDRILELNQNVQDKLNQLLLNEFSQQLGIRHRQSDRQGRVQRRLLTLEDIDALSPFHWGFHVSTLLNRQEGFDILLCHPPGGVLQGTPEEFFEAFQDLFERKGIFLDAFRNHRKQLLTIDADLATAWRDYCGQFTHLSDYFRKSESYRHAAQPPPAQTQMRLYQARLFLERSLRLLRPGGLGAFLLPADLWHQSNAASLREWLQDTTQILGVLELSNHQGALGDLPPRTALSMLWLKQGDVTTDYPHSTYSQKTAPTAADLSTLLQHQIDLMIERLQAS
ncbi:MAG TPA: hypothetical protein V6D29_02245 [Leptolyngbyaceae cyanobacterium]